MLPSTICGSLVLERGPVSFVLDVATGAVTIDRAPAADPHQAEMSREEREAATRQVLREVRGARDVRLGVYRCDRCGASVDVVRHPSRWAGDRCTRCA